MQATLGEPARWSTTDYLIAHVIDAVNVLVNIFQTLHRRKNSPKPKWKPFPRPGFDPDKDKLVLGKGGGMSVADLKKRLARRPATME